MSTPAPVPTYSDVNRDVLATLKPPGNTYFAWMCVVALVLCCLFYAWAWQVWTGMGAAGGAILRNADYAMINAAKSPYARR